MLTKEIEKNCSHIFSLLHLYTATEKKKNLVSVLTCPLDLLLQMIFIVKSNVHFQVLILFDISATFQCWSHPYSRNFLFFPFISLQSSGSSSSLADSLKSLGWLIFLYQISPSFCRSIVDQLLFATLSTACHELGKISPYQWDSHLHLNLNLS